MRFRRKQPQLGGSHSNRGPSETLRTLQHQYAHQHTQTYAQSSSFLYVHLPSTGPDCIRWIRNVIELSIRTICRSAYNTRPLRVRDFFLLFRTRSARKQNFPAKNTPKTHTQHTHQATNSCIKRTCIFPSFSLRLLGHRGRGEKRPN